VALCEAVTETMFKLTNIVMLYAPIGVGAAIAYTVGHGGLGVLVNLAMLVGTLYGALVAFLLLGPLAGGAGDSRPLAKFFKAIKEPAVIAFSTTPARPPCRAPWRRWSGSASPGGRGRFILPLGYSFNSTARRSTCRWRRSSSPRQPTSTCRSVNR
jgi:Na+/H+-dicarboxylate symporter